MSEAVLERIRTGMRGLRAPVHGDKVYKEECVYSFVTPEAEDGLYVNLRTFVGVSSEFLALDHERTDATEGVGLYLHQKWTPKPEEPKEEDQEQSQAEDKAKITRLGIGVEGGAPSAPTEKEFDKVNTLVVLPDHERVPLPNGDLPELVQQVVDGILSHQDATREEQVKASEWEFQPEVSRYALELPQVENPRIVSPDPSTWKCEYCDLTTPLWMNLSTGVVGCGRRQPDGSGGNSHALQHYEDTGRKYPLCVKLGTITPEGADVFSYAPDENDLVIDPHLSQHLEHFGINIMQMKQTEKSMNELNLALNLNWEFDAIDESGKKLVPVTQPGFVGMENLGNSCYLNSVLQSLFSLPEFQQRYLQPGKGILRGVAQPAQVPGDFNAQMAKLAIGLGTDKYIPRDLFTPVEEVERQLQLSPEEREEDRMASRRVAAVSIRPSMFRSLVGKDHAEFSTNKQQDAYEYLLYLLQKMERAERGLPEDAPGARVAAAAGGNLGRLFAFSMQDRLKCLASNGVRFKKRVELGVSLAIPTEEATNREEVQAYEEAHRQWKERDGARKQRVAASAEEPAAKKARRSDEAGESSKETATSSSGAGSTEESPPEVVPAHVPFQACLSQWSAPEAIDGLVSTITQERGPHFRTVRFVTFPRYLMVQMRRYVVGSDWQPKKIDAKVPVPETLDLEHLRASDSLAEGEQPMPEPQDEEPAGAGSAAGGGGSAPSEPDAEIVAMLQSMGVPDNAAKRAAVATENSNAEMAANWYFMHMEDPDINDPLPKGGAAASEGQQEDSFNQENLTMLQSMGFPDDAAKKALHETNHSMERAADWLFSHSDQLDSMDLSISAGPAPAASNEPPSEDGEGKYTLVACISHIGKSVSSGHYVCHVKKGPHGRWIIFNDRKVAVSEDPPLDLGYVYIFRRNDAPGHVPALGEAVDETALPVAAGGGGE